MTSDNPKNIAAKLRIKTALLPSAGVIHGAAACMFGAAKYGPYNWRDKKIALMEYASAIDRHLRAWIDGEDHASDSNVHHLGHIIAGAAIMLDAIELDLVIDDRPPKGTASKLLVSLPDQLVIPSVPLPNRPDAVVADRRDDLLSNLGRVPDPQCVADTTSALLAPSPHLPFL
jgi:hypothetical protein